VVIWDDVVKPITLTFENNCEANDMEADRILRQYAAGERIFREINLAGADLKGVNLSEANFTRANFQDATSKALT
jgi:Pentapeptide repeats (8 copies).